jgi:hypothetical protein
VRTGQVIDLADVRLGIGEQRGEHARNVFHRNRRCLALAEPGEDSGSRLGVKS